MNEPVQPVSVPVLPVPSPYLKSKQAAAYLNMSYSSFRKIATLIRRARHGRYHVDDLNAFARGGGRVRRLRSRRPSSGKAVPIA